MDPKWNCGGQCSKGNFVRHSLQIWQSWEYGGFVGCYQQGILHIVFDEWRNKDHRCHLYNSQHERHFNNLEGPWLGVLFYKAPKCECHIQSCSFHLRLQVHQKPIDYHMQIDFCYQNLIWVWAIHGKTCRVSRFFNEITECSCVHFCLFLSL